MTRRQKRKHDRENEIRRAKCPSVSRTAMISLNSSRSRHTDTLIYNELSSMIPVSPKRSDNWRGSYRAARFSTKRVRVKKKNNIGGSKKTNDRGTGWKLSDRFRFDSYSSLTLRSSLLFVQWRRET
jgi:hypothetical protein